MIKNCLEKKLPRANLRVKIYVLCYLDETNYFGQFLLNSHFLGAKTFI